MKTAQKCTSVYIFERRVCMKTVRPAPFSTFLKLYRTSVPVLIKVEVRGSNSAARFNVEFCEILRRTSQINSFRFAILKNCSHLKIVLNIQFLAVCLGLSKALPYIRVRDYKTALPTEERSGQRHGRHAKNSAQGCKHSIQMVLRVYTQKCLPFPKGTFY